MSVCINGQTVQEKLTRETLPKEVLNQLKLWYKAADDSAAQSNVVTTLINDERHHIVSEKQLLISSSTSPDTSFGIAEINDFRSKFSSWLAETIKKYNEMLSKYNELSQEYDNVMSRSSSWDTDLQTQSMLDFVKKNFDKNKSYFNEDIEFVKIHMERLQSISNDEKKHEILSDSASESHDTKEEVSSTSLWFQTLLNKVLKQTDEDMKEWNKMKEIRSLKQRLSLLEDFPGASFEDLEQLMQHFREENREFDEELKKLNNALKEVTKKVKSMIKPVAN